MCANWNVKRKKERLYNFSILWKESILKHHNAWLVWLSGLSDLQTERSLVQLPVRAHAWVAGLVPSWGRERGNHTLMFLSLSFSLPSPLSKNK